MANFCRCAFCGNFFWAETRRKYCRWRHRLKAQQPIKVVTPDKRDVILFTPPYGWLFSQPYVFPVFDYLISVSPLEGGRRDIHFLQQQRPQPGGLIVPRLERKREAVQVR